MTSIFRAKRDSNSARTPNLESKINTSEHNSSIFKARHPVPSDDINKNANIEGSQEFPFENENDLEREIERGQARGLSRIAERILGFPGDMQDIFLPAQKLKPFLPTSEKLKEFSEHATKGYTKARTPFEEKIGEFEGDVGSFLLPGGKMHGLSRNLFRTIGIPLASNLAKEGLSNVGVKDRTANQVKMGSMVFLDLLSNRGKGGARGLGGRLLDDAEKTIPQGARAEAKDLNNAINILEQDFKFGGTSPSKTEALSKLGEIRDAIDAQGTIDPRQFPAFRRSINELIDQLGGWMVQLPKPIKVRASNNLNTVKKEIIDAGMKYGERENPEFAKLWSEGNEVLSAVNQSNIISNFIKDKFGHPFKSNATKWLFGLGGTSAGIAGLKFAPGAVALGGGLGVGLGAAYQGLKLGMRVAKSPVLRRYYEDVLKAVMNRNVSQMNSSLKKLDAQIARDEKEEKEKIKKLIQD